MRPIYLNQTSVGASTWQPMNSTAAPFAVGIGCVVTGTVNYTVQHTFDDIFDITATPFAFDHSNIVAVTTSKDGNYAFPIRAIRIIINSGAGSVRMALIQGEST